MKSLLPDNKRYIKYSIGKLSDDTFFTNLSEKVTERLKTFLQTTNREELLKRIEEKITKGSLEHGKLPDNFDLIEHEIQQEYLDLIGYTMIHFFNMEEKTENIIP